jgi:hypothetical protein
MMSLQARLQAASSDYQRLQADLSNAVEARQRLDAQLSENELVKKVRPSFYYIWSANGLDMTHPPGVLHLDAEQCRVQTSGTGLSQARPS